MNYMVNYESMSDDQISEMVGELSGVALFDLNNPGDALPIIVENKISIVNPCVNSGIWTAFTFDSEECESEHKNPLRAAMIVYLMMQEDKLNN